MKAGWYIARVSRGIELRSALLSHTIPRTAAALYGSSEVYVLILTGHRVSDQSTTDPRQRTEPRVPV